MQHPTQIFLSNPQALRAEFRIDTGELELWWSPKAGQSSDCLHRNYSSRDAHLNVFEHISLPGCHLEHFVRCDYDPYDTVLYFQKQTLHLSLSIESASLLLWTEAPQAVEFTSHRFDKALQATDHTLHLSHVEPEHLFEFVAQLGTGGGTFRHCPILAPNQPRYARAELQAGQTLVIGVGLCGDCIAQTAERLAKLSLQSHVEDIRHRLASLESSGHIVSSKFPELASLRKTVLRGLHSMIDESGAYRASLKAIYYLIWVRDSGFSFAYQSAAGWPHKLTEVCRFLLDNPLSVNDPAYPQGRMFGQLVNQSLGKLEEDGVYYVIWTLFTHWTQVGHLNFMSADDWSLLEEALNWVETVCWDEARGLYGSHMADETPTHGHRDEGWDYAMGKPLAHPASLVHEGKPVVRNYDVYFNIIMHSCYAMFAAMRQDSGYLQKCERVWPELKKLLHNRTDNIPTYAEFLFEDGSRSQAPYWGPPAGSSCCVWGLTMPNFTPLEDWDSVLASTMDALIAKPEMHFINGLCSAMSAIDTWTYDENKLIELHQRLAKEANTPGKFLPMGGAMPEKFNAPQGNLYHDIRPQGFAMGAWLAAWSNLGLRRLKYGLALRPTQAYERIKHYQWQSQSIDFEFGVKGPLLALEIDGTRIEGSLQVPSKALKNRSKVRLVESDSRAPLWLRASVDLTEIQETANGLSYQFKAHGLSEITFSSELSAYELCDADMQAIEARTSEIDGLFHLRFTHFGEASLCSGNK